MAEETREEGIKLGDLFKPLKRHWWVVLLVTVLFAVVAAVVFEYVFTPRMSSYTLSFVLQYPASETLKYPDGAPFYYQDMIAERTLQSVKSSDEKFSSIDVEKIVKESAIFIDAEMATVGETRQYTGRYTITVRGSYFKNAGLANEFIHAVVSVPEARIKAAANVNFALDEDEFKELEFPKTKLNQLAYQKENITAQYEIWIELLSASYRINTTNKTLFAYASEAKSAFEAEESLRQKIDANNPDGVEEALNEAYEELKDIAQKAQAVSNAIYDQATFTRFDTQNVQASGAPSMMVVGGAALVFAFIVSWIAVWGYDVRKKKRTPPAAPQETELSEEGAPKEE